MFEGGIRTVIVTFRLRCSGEDIRELKASAWEKFFGERLGVRMPVA